MGRNLAPQATTTSHNPHVAGVGDIAELAADHEIQVQRHYQVRARQQRPHVAHGVDGIRRHHLRHASTVSKAFRRWSQADRARDGDS